MQQPSAHDPVLLYDGVCGLCNKSVQMILDHDKRKEMRFAPLQSDYGRQVIARHPELKNADSIVFVERGSSERVFIRSNAALRVASYLGGAWKLLLFFRIIPRPVRDFFYDLMAKYRYKFFGKYDSCMLPSPDVRSRFLEM
ncbi:MAG: DCC1-like thiol-disulfide oxidoreductase family protein [Blastocatellia bacterium]